MKCIQDEIPFEVPEGWEWARLGTICSKITDGTHHSPENYPTGEYKYVTAKNIKFDGIILGDITYVTAEIHKEIFSRCNPEFGDILYIKDGATSGIATINTLHEEFSMLSSVALLKPACGMNNWYMCYVMQSPYFYNITRDDMKGVGITRITLNMLVSRLIPVPPMLEQKQISIKCRELISLSATIEHDKQLIQNLLFKTKTKILDLAIRGKLVPQDPDDEPASVLLDHIRAEKEELIKQGKIKRDKKESVIFKGEDNSYYETIGTKTFCINKDIPFNIPDNWSWCRLKSLAAAQENSFVDGPFGSNLKTDHYTQNQEVRIIQLNNIGEFEWKNQGIKYTTYEHAETLSRCKSYPGDIVIAKMMPAGRAIIIPDLEKLYIISSDCVRLHPSNIVNSEYIMYMINSPSINKYILDNVQGIGRTRTSLGKLKELLVPIPPYNQQVKISNSIKNIYNLLNLNYS